ncbi:ScbA/BarX family gamma-butyrolactone biosynthesis protein, partial [Motilibacter deserti]
MTETRPVPATAAANRLPVDQLSFRSAQAALAAFPTQTTPAAATEQLLPAPGHVAQPSSRFAVPAGDTAEPTGRAVRRAGVRSLTFERTVARGLVHRASVAEVFITDAVEEAPDTFLVGAQWPRAHGFYRHDRAGRHDPMIAIESVRQAGLFLAHVFYGVPQGAQFIFTELSYRLLDAAALTAGSAPAQAVLRVSVAPGGLRRGVPTALDLDVVIEIDGRPLARLGGGLRCIPRATYEVLRRRVLKADPVRVGPEDPQRPELGLATSCPGLADRSRCDVVLAGPEGGTPAADGSSSFALRVDVTHPVLFDHPLDHVPGMLQIEAVRQAAYA